MFDKIFLINLKERSDRLIFMNYKLKRSGIKNYDVIGAINGYSEDLIKLYDMYKYQKYYYGIISSPGAIGLLQTWKILLEKCFNYDRILILEDDIYFHEKFHELNDPSLYNHDVVMLGGNQLRWDEKQEESIKNNNYYKFSSNKWYCTYGTYAISLNNKAIKVIHNKIKGDLHDKSMTIDVEINKLIRDGELTGVTFFPNLIVPETRDSDNMSVRNLDEISIQRKWNLKNYLYIDIYNQIIKLRENHINPRQNREIKFDEITNEDVIKIYDGKELPFVVIIPSHNNEKWVENNLLSVIQQKYYNWRVIYIDDNSSDGTSKLAEDIINKNNKTNCFILIKNKEQKYQTYNRYIAYMSCSEEEICVLLDGDDWLAHSYVFQILNEEYQKNNLLISYGQFGYFENGRISFISGKYKFPEDVIKNNSYRKYNWISQHLRTYKAGIIQKIPLHQLKDQDGNWLNRCSDMAEMFWVLENSDGRHKNIGSMLYIYNKDNSTKYKNSYYNEDSKTREALVKHVRSHNDKKIKPIKKNKKYNLYNKCNTAYYQIDFTQKETFIFPINGQKNIFKVYVKLTHETPYNFTLEKMNGNFFKIAHSSKVNHLEYELTITFVNVPTEIIRHQFKVVARSVLYPYNKVISNFFYVYTYAPVIRTPFRHRINVQVLPRDHGQDCEVIDGSWDLVDDFILTKKIIGYRLRRNKIYNIILSFNEKELSIFIMLYINFEGVC